ncbi:transcriptional regulator [Rhizobium sp. P44RR-XXIV]|uniref:winged helix-turn-helix domain-containing protein n=1 Tax=Rhizobium sp. P44RR-XXIV TaxID=1921145 RepID=UPI000986BF50|nr:transcriptional regulator [Rhizobium sp. P44RR-XXIV]TIX91654.1 transcriptional regulator [Rhizobium sp. P44RR-XXIV]
MAVLNEVIHQSLRLKIMAALYAQTASEALEFTTLKKITGATDGNLGSHLSTLEQAGYIATTKAFVDRKPQTRISLTREGRRAFREHVAYLREIVELAEGK